MGSDVITLSGMRVLVAEDEEFVAETLQEELTFFGAHVLGPVMTLKAALALVSTEPAIDAAILDVNLSGEMVFEVADQLAARKVPFIFTSGYQSNALPERYQGVKSCVKPYSIDELVKALKSL